MLNGYSYNFLKCLTLWGVFCSFFFSSLNSQCQKVSVLIWYRKLQNTPSEKKKKSIGKCKKAGVRTRGSTRLLPKPAEPTGTRRELRIAWRGNVCSRIFNCFFEGGRISPSCCGAQSTVPGISHRAPRFGSFGFGVWFSFFVGWVFVLFCGVFSAISFPVEGFHTLRLKKGAACSWEGALRARAGAAGRGGCAAGRSAEAQVGAPRGSAFGGTGGSARPAAR